VTGTDRTVTDAATDAVDGELLLPGVRPAGPLRWDE